MSVYQSVIEENIGTQAFPIDENKMMAFITYQFKNGRACSTLMNYISAFSYYFHENNLDNLTQSLQFKRFKSGLRHKLKSGHFPYQKNHLIQNVSLKYEIYFQFQHRIIIAFS